MNFAFSEEQDELRKSIRRFLEEKSPSSAVRTDMESSTGFNQALWDQAATELGLCAIAIPEAYGGMGFSQIEQGIVMEELGRSLACLPYFSSVILGANALLASGDSKSCESLLPGIASGDIRMTLALYEPDGGFSIDAISTTITGEGASATITGSKAFVIDGASATDYLVLAQGDEGLSLVHLEASAPGVSRESVLTLDQTRHMANVQFENSPVTIVGDPGGAREVLERVLDLASVALANEMVGGAQRCLEMSVDYAKARIQFGRPIGSFQAIKHKCADILVDVESAKSAAYFAAWAAASDPDELRVAAPLAKAFCGDAYFHAASENIQIHGGIGFTWEHDAHLYFKRAKSSQLLFGDSSHFREVLATRIGV